MFIKNKIPVCWRRINLSLLKLIYDILMYGRTNIQLISWSSIVINTHVYACSITEYNYTETEREQRAQYVRSRNECFIEKWGEYMYCVCVLNYSVSSIERSNRWSG